MRASRTLQLLRIREEASTAHRFQAHADLYQTKVRERLEISRVRLSGIVLLGLFDNRGTVFDSQDIPQVAPSPAGSLRFAGSSFSAVRCGSRQIGLEAFSVPTLLGAHTQRQHQNRFRQAALLRNPTDIFEGLVRLRTAGRFRMDWSHTSTSSAVRDYSGFRAASAYIAGVYGDSGTLLCGTLWAWAPQVPRRTLALAYSERSRASRRQGGIM